eukprot:1320510-Prymnesium_polylepis.1
MARVCPRTVRMLGNHVSSLWSGSCCMNGLDHVRILACVLLVSHPPTRGNVPVTRSVPMGHRAFLRVR